jgi:hypothetical protein
MADDGRPNSTPAAATPTGRKAYTTPRLEEYGHVAKLTQSSGSTKSEPANPMSRTCL